MKRRIFYVTGTRADFGLLAGTLDAIARDPHLELGLCVTGMHLLEEFGNTVRDVERSGLPIVGRVPVSLGEGSGAEMAIAIADALSGLTRLFLSSRPDLLFVLGDRGEMLAATLAAVHLNIPVVHLHGGERSGTVDESVRHAISKLAHYHFVSTEASRERLVRMGEIPETIHVTGAPGLDSIAKFLPEERESLCADVGFDPALPVCLLLFHPVVQSAGQAGEQVLSLLTAVRDLGLQTIALMPNADAGNHLIRQALRDVSTDRCLRLFRHLARDRFLSWMARADVMLGNSSSGIIEAASFGTPVVNVGDRQCGRERNRNTIDVESPAQVRPAIERALALGRLPIANVYGDGGATERIVSLLKTLDLSASILNKLIAY